VDKKQAKYLRGLYRLSIHMRVTRIYRIDWAVKMFNEHYYNKADVDAVDAQEYLIRYSKSETER
jgi:hypothetical protein